MRFSGYWVSQQDSTITVLPDRFDETDLSEKSNWTEAHQNEDPSCPAGYIKPKSVLLDVARRLVQMHPHIAAANLEPMNEEFSVNSLEDFGLLCLKLLPERGYGDES
jgi:hypothetical protein